jgi:LysM repeat protein
VQPKPAVATAVRPLAGKVHTVAKGDTVFSLARRYGVSQAQLVRINNIPNARDLVAGQRLVVPGGAMTVNGVAVATDVAPLQTRRGMSTTPFRFVVEALGGSVSWIGPANRVEASAGDRGMISITIGSKQATVNDEKVLMELAAYLESGRTMVPTRFVSEALDVTIEMDEDSGNIYIRSNR